MRAPRHQRILLGLLCGLAGSLSAQEEVLEPLKEGAPEHVITRLRMQDGLPSDRVRDVIQTRDGYLWVATFNGLARFDGVRFRVFNDANTPELKNSLINCLFEDSAGRLWIGSDTGEITWRDDQGFHSLAITNGWQPAPISRIVESADGIILALSRAGHVLLITNLTGGSILHEGVGPRYSDLVTDRDGAVWLVRYGGMLARLENGQEFVPDDATPRPQGGYRSVGLAREGGLWIRDGQRLRRWAKGEWVEDRGEHEWGTQDWVSLFEAEDGRVWVGAANGNVFVIASDGSEFRINRVEGLGHKRVASIHEDRENNIWIGTLGGGLELLRTRVVSTLTPADHWEYRAVESVTPAESNGLWIGTMGAGVYHYDGRIFVRHMDTNSLRGNSVRALLQGDRDRLWIGTQGSGLRYWEDQTFSESDAPNRGLYYAAFRASDEALWFGSQNGVSRLSGDAWTLWGTDLHRADVRCITETTDGSIWLGMRGGGVARYRGTNVTQFLKADGLPYDYVWTLAADEDGGLWIGTAGGGLARWHDGEFSSITTRDGLPSDFICCIQSDDSGHLWISSYAGIFRVAKSDLERFFRGEIKTVNCLVLDTSDGLSSLEMAGGNQPAGCKTADGRLWFGSSGGLVVVDPARLRVNEVPPPVVIEEILIDGNSATLDTGPGPEARIQKRVPRLRVPAGSRQLEIRYTALSLSAPKRVLFKYRLNGLDDEWVQAGNRRSAYYSRLAPGDYEFRVMACNNFGYWNEQGAGLSFRVLPSFWQTWWFIPACWLVGVSLVGWAVIAALRRRHHRRVEELRREQLVERERARIAQDLHDDLGTGLTEIDTTSTLGRDLSVTPEESREYFEEISSRSHEMVVALDEIVWAANPHNDTLGALASYFVQFAQRFLRSTRLRCRFDVSNTLPVLPLNAEQRHNLFMAFKEALNNAVRHAEASELRLSISLVSTALQIVVEDDGQGFDPMQTREGANGVSNMQSRLSSLGGQCDIGRAGGGGTRVTLRLPVQGFPSRK